MPRTSSRATVVVIRDDRAARLPSPSARQLDGLVEVVVGQHRADRAERLDRVHRFCVQRLLAVQQRRHEERAFVGVGIDESKVVAAADDVASGARARATRSRTSLRWPWLASAPMSTSLLAGCRCGSRRAPSQRLDDVAGDRRGSDDAADRRALLAGLARHLTRDFLDEQIELRRAGHGVRPEDRRVQRVGLRREGDRLADDARMLLQELSRVLGAGERDRVLAVQMVEQVADAAADELQRALRQEIPESMIWRTMSSVR